MLFNGFITQLHVTECWLDNVHVQYTNRLVSAMKLPKPSEDSTQIINHLLCYPQKIPDTPVRASDLG